MEHMGEYRDGLPEALRQELAAGRRAKGLTQAALGKLAGLPQMHISSIETGKVIPRFDTLLNIVRLLDYDFLLVPRELVPAAQALIASRHRNQRDGDEEDSPLYTADEPDDHEA